MMRRLICGIFLVLLGVSQATAAQTSDDRQDETREAYNTWKQLQDQQKAINERMARATVLRPVRRDEPMRYENIHDTEVLEIRGIVSSMYPDAIVSIGTVVTGCPCEDGATCTAQVWVVPEGTEDDKGLLLSRISDHWTLGPVQAWWIAWQAFQLQMDKTQFTDQLSQLQAWNAQKSLILRFPVCADSAKK